MSGLMVRNIVVGTLMGLGYDVINISIFFVPFAMICDWHTE